MAFACTYTSNSLHITPRFLAARRNPKTQQIRKQKSRNTSQPPKLSAGGEATTFTRLPPKDDFIDSPAQSLAETIKLSESLKPEVFDKKRGGKSRFGSRNGEVKENTDLGYKGFELDKEVDGSDGSDAENDDEMSDTDYGRYELYEVNSDNEFDYDDDDDFDDDFDDEEEGVVKEKEKGLPAVMRAFDRAKIYVKAGDGGNGVVAFRREKFVPFGGPSGGDGGRGGNVYLKVDDSMNSLLAFRRGLHFRAGRGSHGQGSKLNGAKGKDVVVKVPPGTVVREADGGVLFELLHPGEKALLLRGGRGGRGNASFKSGTNKVPKIAENGEEGIEMWLELELKLVADVGIVGAPNAGKSTFLSVISAAQPAIANYPFTTLLPNLGVVSFDYDATMVVADLPGLLEGAHTGFGLGHEFLRHTERCSVLVHVVDGSSEQPEYEFDAVRLELELFSPEIAEKPYIVVLNKMDLMEAYEKWPSFKENLKARGIEPYCMSALSRDGTQEVISSAYRLLQKTKAANKEEGITGPQDLNYVADMVEKQHTSPIREFEISHDSSTNTWHVDGAGLQRFVQMTNWRYMDSERRFQHVLEACGVNKSLLKRGVKEGDTVVVGEMELVWHDYADAANQSGPVSKKKWASDFIV